MNIKEIRAQQAAHNEKIDKAVAKLPKPPFHNISIDGSNWSEGLGGLSIKDMHLTYEETMRFFRWMQIIYGEKSITLSKGNK